MILKKYFINFYGMVKRTRSRGPFVKFSSVLSDSDKLKLIPNNLNFPEKFHDKCLSGRSCSWQLRLEPSHIASVLSKLTLSPAHSENLLKTNND
jgi:hypothetical protein